LLSTRTKSQQIWRLLQADVFARRLRLGRIQPLENPTANERRRRFAELLRDYPQLV
jgi:hypothetical protein